MTPEQKAAPHASPRGPAPLAPAVRQRLQKTFEHAKRCVEKSDFDYAHELFTQCVSEDPANLAYAQAMLANLHRKYDNNKRGARLAGLKIKSHRSAMAKAADKGQWTAAFTAGCGALALNPWDVATLVAMADACEGVGVDECQLYYLRCGLDVDAKDPLVNRRAALTLQRMGQFDQAIACWHRVEQAKPGDEEAQRAISHLSVEKTIHLGGYDPGLLGVAKGSSRGEARSPAVASIARGAPAADEQEDAAAALPPEQRHLAAIEANAADLAAYFRLADHYVHEQQFDQAQQTLDRAHQVSGGGDLQVRQRLEDLQGRRVPLSGAAAQKHYSAPPTPPAQAPLGPPRGAMRS